MQPLRSWLTFAFLLRWWQHCEYDSKLLWVNYVGWSGSLVVWEIMDKHTKFTQGETNRRIKKVCLQYIQQHIHLFLFPVLKCRMLRPLPVAFLLMFLWMGCWKSMLTLLHFHCLRFVSVNRIYCLPLKQNGMLSRFLVNTDLNRKYSFSRIKQYTYKP